MAELSIKKGVYSLRQQLSPHYFGESCCLLKRRQTTWKSELQIFILYILLLICQALYFADMSWTLCYKITYSLWGLHNYCFHSHYCMVIPGHADFCYIYVDFVCQSKAYTCSCSTGSSCTTWSTSTSWHSKPGYITTSQCHRRTSHPLTSGV